MVAPFIYSDMTCPHCLNGSTISCLAGGNFGNGEIDGGRGEAVRVPLAGGTLVPVPGSAHPEATLRSRRLGAERIIALSRHPDRQKIALEFGATDIIETRGEEASQTVLDLTRGIGADAALECVGTEQSIATAAAIARPGSTIGIVGVPHGQPPFAQAFFRNVGWRGGPAPARIYIPELLGDVLDGTINPGLVFDYETSLDDIGEAYRAMDERRAIKSLVRIGAI